MKLDTLECAHVEKYACEACATPRTPKITRSSGVKSFNKLTSNVSRFHIVDYNNREIIDAFLAGA